MEGSKSYNAFVILNSWGESCPAFYMLNVLKNPVLLTESSTLNNNETMAYLFVWFLNSGYISCTIYSSASYFSPSISCSAGTWISRDTPYINI